MSRVVLIEPVSSGWSLITKGKEYNHEIIVFTFNQGDRIIPNEFLNKADEVIIVDTNDDKLTIEKAKQLHKQKSIDAFIPGFEYYVPLSAEINKELGLNGLNTEYVGSLRYKDAMRDRLKVNEVKIPRYKRCNDFKELIEAVDHIGGYPCVIKPVDCSGSFNVRKVNNIEELREGYEAIKNIEITDLGRNAKKQILIESYLTGPEYSVEGFVNGNEIKIVSITEKFLSKEPYFVEVGHIVNVPMNQATKMEIDKYIVEVIKALSINLGPFHAEIRLTDEGPILIEIGARLAGDKICDLIYHSKGIDLYKIMFDCYLGNEIQNTKEEKEKFAGIKFFVRPGLDKYKQVLNLEKVKNEPGFIDIRITHPEDQKIPDLTSFLGRLGYTIFMDKSYNGLKNKLNHADNLVEFITEG